MGVTLALLVTTAGLVTWVYLRDRDPSGWQAQEAVLAKEDAAMAVGGGSCRNACRTHLLGQTGPHRWLISVAVAGRRQCLQVDPNRFTVSSLEGDTGVAPAPCPVRPAPPANPRPGAPRRSPHP